MAKPTIETATGTVFYPEEIDLIEVRGAISKWWHRPRLYDSVESPENEELHEKMSAQIKRERIKSL